MPLVIMLLSDIYVRGWITVSGCTRATQVRVRSPMNGSTRPMISWNGHLARWVKEQVKSFVPAVSVQTEKDKQRRSWGSIFGRMDSRQTIPGGSTTVKPIA